MNGIRASEVGELASSALAEIIERATVGVPIADYAEGELFAWTVIEEGGWDTIGASEATGGGGASLRDLVEVAQAWGYGCIPIPLIESTWAKRWSASARELSGPVSMSVARSTGGGGFAPFGAFPGIVLGRSIGGDVDVLETSDLGEPELFAPTLRSSTTSWSARIEDDAARELGVLFAAEAVGSAQRLLDLSVQYAKEREQFGKPIGAFQAVKHRLADMHSSTQYAQSAVVWAALEPANAIRASRYAIDTSITVAEGSIQVHGGMGFTWEMGLHFFLRRMLVRRQLLQFLWP